MNRIFSKTFKFLSTRNSILFRSGCHSTVLRFQLGGRPFSSQLNQSELEWKIEPIEQCHTPPSSWYHSQSFLEMERKTVFEDQWICVGRTDQLKEPGDYISGNLVGEPYMIVVDSNGKIGAFFNVCRHHAAELVKGEGKLCGDEIKCPYHGWTYSTDGRLKKATKLKGIKEFSAKNYGLIPIQLQVLGHFVFVSISPNNPWDSFRKKLEPIIQTLEETNWNNLQFLTRRKYTIECNWKIFVENYLDGGLHVPFLHCGLNAQLSSSSYSTKCFENFSVQSVKSTKSNPTSGIDFNERIGEGAVYAFLYPNFMINRYGRFMDINYIFPVGHQKTEVIFDYFFDYKDADKLEPDFIEKALKASDMVQQEDIIICESVQRGVGSKAYQEARGRYVPSVEHALYHFHSLLYQDIAKVSTSKV